MSNSHNSENSAARQASADAENLAPAEAENLASAKAENPAPECSAESAVLDVPREEIPGVGGATPTVLQTDVTVDIPLEATRAIYVFNARVANAREGYPTARCDLFVKSQGADIFLASLAPGQKYEAPLAKVGDEVVAMCADTKREFLRWTIVLRQGYDKMTRSILGKEYVKRIWTDPVEQKVVLGVWTNWRRLLTPKLLDYDMSHWDEPMDDPVTGKVAIPFDQRFPYYLVTRHQVLSCFFVGARDSFSRNERLADLMNTLMWTWTLTVALIGEDIALRVFVIAFLMTPISAVFQIASRVGFCGVEWGRILTVPLFLIGFIAALVVSVNNSDKPGFSGAAGSFVLSLAFEWFFNRPAGITLRVWLYGKGWNKYIGIGPKSKWWFDRAARGAGLG